MQRKMDIFHTTSGFKKPNISRNTRWNCNFSLPFKNLPLKLHLIKTPLQKLGRNNLYYRYMYLKTYAKFTFYIKSQRHVSDENFLYYCCYTLSWHNFLLQCLKYVRQKDSLLFVVKVLNFFRYVPQNIH